QARLLHGQPRRRPDHVEGPDQRAGRKLSAGPNSDRSQGLAPAVPVPTSGRVLGLETSCDETAAAVVTSEGLILSNVVSSPVEPPFLCLLASGGHTLLIDVPEPGAFRVLGTTLDDAAGEAFDKGARLLGLGYPGGAAIDRVAREGDPAAYDFPVARVAGLDFSFSGLKTALLYAVRDLPEVELARRRADLAASYERAIVSGLVARTNEAAEQTGAPRTAVVGGVAANSELRAALPEALFAPLPLCTDNAAMIASAARYTEAVPF